MTFYLSRQIILLFFYKKLLQSGETACRAIKQTAQGLALGL